jgi:hypothetical protein
MMKKKARHAAQSVAPGQSAMPAPDQVLDLRECADRMLVSLRTLKRVIEAGEGPPVVLVTRWRKGVLESDFIAWLRSRRVGPGIEEQPRRRGRPRTTSCGIGCRVMHSEKATKEKARSAIAVASRASHSVSSQENPCFYCENAL